MKREKAIEIVTKMAYQIRMNYINNGELNRANMREMESIALENNIFVCFDDDDLPAMVEDTTF